MQYIAILFVLIGIMVAIRRAAGNSASNTSGVALREKLRKNPNFASKIIKELDIPYKKVDLSSVDLTKINHGQGQRELDAFTVILHIQPIDKNSFLYITIIQENTIDIGISGTVKNAYNVYNFNFLLKVSPEKNSLEIFSDIYEDLNTKNIKTDVAVKILNSLKK